MTTKMDYIPKNFGAEFKVEESKPKEKTPPWKAKLRSYSSKNLGSEFKVVTLAHSKARAFIKALRRAFTAADGYTFRMRTNKNNESVIYCKRVRVRNKPKQLKNGTSFIDDVVALAKAVVPLTVDDTKVVPLTIEEPRKPGKWVRNAIRPELYKGEDFCTREEYAEALSHYVIGEPSDPSLLEQEYIDLLKEEGYVGLYEEATE